MIGTPLGAGSIGHVLVDGIGRDDHASGMNRDVARQADDALGQADDLGPGFREIDPAQLGQLSEPGQQVVVFTGGFPEPGQPPRHLADLAVGQSVHLGRFANGHAGPEGHVVADHGRVTGILIQNRINDPVAFIPGKIDVDVGRVLAPRVEKALEVEIVLDGADVCDPHAVGHQRCGAATPSADTRAAVHDVLNHQEVRRKTHLPDDTQFVFQAFNHRFGQVVTVAAPGTGVGGLPQKVLGRFAPAHRARAAEPYRCGDR